MKIYKNPWVTRESYFVKTGTAKSATMEAAKSSGYSIDFCEGAEDGRGGMTHGCCRKKSCQNEG